MAGEVLQCLCRDSSLPPGKAWSSRSGAVDAEGSGSGLHLHNICLKLSGGSPA